MILEKGDMWSVYDQSDLFLITANSTLNSKGELIMGAGIAKEVKEKFPDYPAYFGHCILMSVGAQGIYGTYITTSQKVGLFQTKIHWSNPSTLQIILISTASLLKILNRRPWKNCRVDLNFPGIGKGQLSREDVLPIISVLPDNVHIWELG